MSADTRREIGDYLTEQPLTRDDDSDLIVRLREQRDQARAFCAVFEVESRDALARISEACLLVDEVLDHAAEECTCRGESVLCVWHKIDQALRGTAS